MISIVYTTTENEGEAKRIASSLIEHKLAACINMHPIDSLYMWEGKVQYDKEVALSIKTTSCKVDQVTEHIRIMHSYELPAIIAWKIEGEKEYLEWIARSVGIEPK
ncbi:MAG: divalent-cation tolerance protein CutA [Methanolobus sp.]|nr:divalent-cation tolerance protein CutA [Methanolobus sp.]